MRQQALSADNIARAIVTAARTYSIDPIEALTSRNDQRRVAIAPAVFGLARALDIPVKRICNILGVDASNVSHAKRRRGEAFWQAATAAETAVLNMPAAPAIAPAPRRYPGLLTSFALPAPIHPKPVHRGPRILSDSIMEVLIDAPTTAPTLAFLCDAKELQITSALSQLEHAGRVTPGPIPEQGARHRHWRVNETAQP